MGNTPDISIVTVNFNTREVLRTLLDAVAAHHGDLAIEHWVIDNASVDGSVQMVREDYPKVKVIANEENMGPGRARNVAFVQTTGKYIINLDSDVIVHEGALETLVSYMEEHPEVALAGCKLLNGDGTHQASAYHLPLIGPALWRRLRRAVTGYREDFNSAATPINVGYLKGAIVVYRRSALDQVGLFDPQYKHYMEEVDLQLRLHKAGWKISYVPTVAATHLWRQGMDQNFVESEFHRHYSALWFTRKHWPVWAHLYTRAALIGWALYYARICSDDALSRRFPGKHPALIRGIFSDVLRVSIHFRALYPEATSG